MGRHAVVTSGHYLATAGGFRIMEQGGNAVDAAAAMCFCLNLLEPQSNGTGGDVPILIYSAKERKTIAALKRRGHDVVVADGWENGKVMGIRYDKERGVILGGVSPRRTIGYALGW